MRTDNIQPIDPEDLASHDGFHQVMVVRQGVRVIIAGQVSMNKEGEILAVGDYR